LISPVVGSSVLGSSVLGSSVLGSSVLGSSVLGSSVLGSSVLGSSVLGSSILGSSTLETLTSFSLVIDSLSCSLPCSLFSPELKIPFNVNCEGCSTFGGSFSLGRSLVCNSFVISSLGFSSIISSSILENISLILSFFEFSSSSSLKILALSYNTWKW